MSTLRLRIHKDLGGQQGSPQIYASIRSIGKEKQPAREELIPLSYKSERAKAITVTPGRYYVEAVLPSGELLYEDVVVESNETKDVVLMAEASPHEWLAWQQISGNVKPKVKAKRRRSSKSGKRRPYRTSSGGIKAVSDLNLDLDELVASIDFMPEPEPEVNIQSPLQWLTKPQPTLSKADSASSWKFLSSLTGTSAAELINKLNSDKPPTQIPPAAWGKDQGVFRLSSAFVPDSGAVVLQLPLDEGERTYVAIPRRTSVELVSIPLPWKVVSTNQPAVIEVLVQIPADSSAFCSSVIPRDNDCGPLLGYLSSGSLPEVRRYAEMGKEKLYYKFENPLAAAAGAYALVGTAHEATDKDWHNWVRNLKNNFHHLPDGAIQWGTLRMRMRRSADDVAEAITAFKTAYSRGLPFYSLGIKWLLEGLEWAAANDPEAKQMADNVRPIAYRTNYQQPFTTLRIGG